MGVYKNDTLIEQSIYGSSRLGLMTASSKTGYRTLGGKKYELSNHLGNVLAVVSDNINLDQDSTWASVVNMTDYYPFGLAMDGRTVQDSAYRYGFGGHEKDDEVKGSGKHLSFGDYGYDPVVGRRWNVDPLTYEFPSWSPYNFVLGSPIRLIDPDGRAPMPPSTFVDENGNVVGGTINDGDKGVYQVSGLTKNNFSNDNITQYKQEGTKIGETFSLYSFYNPAAGDFMGSVNVNSTESAKLINEATNDLQNATAGMNMLEAGKYYGVNAKGAGSRFDLKTYGLPNPKKASDADIYKGSIYRPGVIMTRRDAGNYFAGKAAGIIGLSKNTMLSGFGGFASSDNNLNSEFGFKSILNLIDSFFMGSALDFVPGNQNGQILQYIPPFSEYKGSRDLQIKGFDENK